MFQADMQTLFKPFTQHVHSAPAKTFGRMFNKLVNPNDHGDPSLLKPRPAKNVDILRSGIELQKSEDVEKAYQALKAKYRILRVKNTHDPNLQGFGGYRSMLINFAYQSNVTFKDVFSDTVYHEGSTDFEGDRWTARPKSTIGQKWFDHVSDLSPQEDWRRALVGLSFQARKQPESKITLAAEVQLIYKPYMDGRALSHLLFKISRCETGVGEMARDFSIGYQSESEESNARAKAVQRIAKEARDRASSADRVAGG